MAKASTKRGSDMHEDKSGRGSTGNQGGHGRSGSQGSGSGSNGSSGRSGRGSHNGSSTRSSSGRSDNSSDNTGRSSSSGQGQGWHGDPEGHAEAGSHSHDNDSRSRRQSGSSRSSNGRETGSISMGGGRMRDEEGRFVPESAEGGRSYGSGQRGHASQHDAGDAEGEAEDRRSSRRTRSPGGWFGDSQGHAEAGRHSHDNDWRRSRGYPRSARQEDEEEGRQSYGYREDDTDRFGGGSGNRRGQGGWFGDSQGHAEAGRHSHDADSARGDRRFYRGRGAYDAEEAGASSSYPYEGDSRSGNAANHGDDADGEGDYGYSRRRVRNRPAYGSQDYGSRYGNHGEADEENEERYGRSNAADWDDDEGLRPIAGFSPGSQAGRARDRQRGRNWEGGEDF